MRNLLALRPAWVFTALTSGFLCGCATPHDILLTEHPQAPTAGDYLKLSRPKPACEPPVELVSAGTEAVRPYRELATLSANCYPGAPRVCEDQLKERACALHADAVILLDPEKGGTPPGASSRPQMAMSGRAVRWEAQ